MPAAQFQLKIGERAIEARAVVPDGLTHAADLLPVLRSLSDAVVAVASEGKQVSCRAGCGACCRQMVPISEPEALALAELVAAMPKDRQERVLARFTAAEEAVNGMREPMDVIGLLDAESRQRLGLEYFALGVACPFLEDESCGIYEHRPLACREYLVTSPAEYCASPSAAVVSVPQPVKLSSILYRFGDGRGEDEPRVVVLVRLLEWAREHSRESEPRFEGTRLFEGFVRKVAGESCLPSGRRAEATAAGRKPWPHATIG